MEHALVVASLQHASIFDCLGAAFQHDCHVVQQAARP